MDTGIRFDVPKMLVDMAEKGWISTDLARETGLSNMTISRFWSGERRTARTAKKIATALGKGLKRYIVREPKTAVA